MRDPFGPKAEFVTVGPHQARQFLGNNIGNRNVRASHVEQLARDMSEGRWQECNGDTIRIAKDGRVLDGQHRLLAVVESDCTFRFLVVTGLEAEVQDTIDVGAKRSAADALKFASELDGDAKDVAALARGLFTYRTGTRPSNTEVLAEARARIDDLLPAVAIARRLRQERMNGGIAVFGIAWLILAEVDAADAARFFELFTSGAELPAGSPLLLLRKTFQMPSFSTTRDRSTMRASIGLIIRAWNAWRKGKTLTKFAPVSEFPVPR